MKGHVDPETLAAFGEELLPRRKARRVAAHLARCAQCAGLDAQLADLPALLAGTPAPPMPDALTARIEAAIAAEAAARTATTAAGAPGVAAATGAGAPSAAGAPPAAPRDNAGDARDRRQGRAAAPGRSRLALRAAAVAAAVAVIVGGGYGVSRLLSGGGPASTAAPALAPAGSPALAPAATGSAAHVPAASRPHGTERSGAASSAARARAAPLGAAADLVVASGTNYRPGRLQAQVKAVLARFGKAPAPNAGRIPGSANGLARLAACVAHATGGLRARLVDQARYDGKPATVIVVPAGPDRLRVLVAGPRCSATATGLITSTVMPGPG